MTNHEVGKANADAAQVLTFQDMIAKFEYLSEYDMPLIFSQIKPSLKLNLSGINPSAFTSLSVFTGCRKRD